MELTYMVRGADGKEYGPATLDQLAAWTNQGRLTAQQLIKRTDTQDWAEASTFGELQGLFRPPTAPDATPPTIPPAGGPGAPINPAMVVHMKSGASWFYWIAALSLINSVSSLSGSGFGFALGLGITHFLAQIGNKSVVLVLDLLVSGLFVLFGVFAHKGHTWAFIVGMVLFALDTVLAFGQSWLSVALHGLALFFLFRGMQACRQLNRAAG